MAQPVDQGKFGTVNYTIAVPERVIEIVVRFPSVGCGAGGER
jgi:hypothetical protein